MKKVLKYSGLAFLCLMLLLLVIPYLIPVAKYSHDIAGPFENSRMLDLDGTLVHVRQWEPADEPKGRVLLVHGFCGSTFNWEALAPALSGAGYMVVAIDIPPFGYSDRFPAQGHGLSARIEYAWRAVEAVTPGDSAPWWLVGHSMGGSIVQAMAQSKPDKTSGIVLVDGGQTGNRAERSGETRGGISRTAMSLGPVRRWVEVVAERFIFQEDYISELCISAAGTAPSEDILKNYLATLRVPQTASAILDMFRTTDSFDLDISQMTQPTLIVWGEQDTWVPLARGEALRQAITHAEWVLIEEAYHMPMETHVEEFNTAVLDFLSRHEPSASS